MFKFKSKTTRREDDDRRSKLMFGEVELCDMKIGDLMAGDMVLLPFDNKLTIVTKIVSEKYMCCFGQYRTYTVTFEYETITPIWVGCGSNTYTYEDDYVLRVVKR